MWLLLSITGYTQTKWQVDVGFVCCCRRRGPVSNLRGGAGEEMAASINHREGRNWLQLLPLFSSSFFFASENKQ
jgi:hypothetical protein